MRNPRAVALSATAALVLAGLASPALANPNKGPGNNNGNPNNPTKIAQAVKLENLMDHLEQFQAIADANGGNRAVATPGYEASAEYVESVLEAAGYAPERQYFTINLSRTVSESLRENSPEQRDIAHGAMEFSPNTPDGGVTADLTAPSSNIEGCDAAAWEGADLSGQIALISRGTCPFGQKSEVAGALGAEGVIIFNNIPGSFSGTLGGLHPDHAPTTGVLQAEGQALLEKMANGPVNVTLDIQTFSGQVETFNVIAETSKGRTDNVVMAGAHLDGAYEGAGINDNASGSVAILETAVQLAKVNKLNNQVRFVWWGAEENGLLGSNHYVADLLQNNPAELDNIATYLNFDMVASPNHIIGVYDADESTYDAPVDVPPGSAATEKVFTDWFDSIDQPWVDTEFSGRSDYQAFINAGVPSSGLFTGADGRKTAEEVELFGGTAGVLYDPNYHTVLDDITNINMEAFDIMSDAIAAATLSLAQDTSAVNGERSAGKSGKPHPGGPVPVGDEADAA